MCSYAYLVGSVSWRTRVSPFLHPPLALLRPRARLAAGDLGSKIHVLVIIRGGVHAVDDEYFLMEDS